MRSIKACRLVQQLVPFRMRPFPRVQDHRSQQVLICAQDRGRPPGPCISCSRQTRWALASCVHALPRRRWVCVWGGGWGGGRKTTTLPPSGRNGQVSPSRVLIQCTFHGLTVLSSVFTQVHSCRGPADGGSRRGKKNLVSLSEAQSCVSSENYTSLCCASPIQDKDKSPSKVREEAINSDLRCVPHFNLRDTEHIA